MSFSIGTFFSFHDCGIGVCGRIEEKWSFQRHSKFAINPQFRSISNVNVDMIEWRRERVFFGRNPKSCLLIMVVDLLRYAGPDCVQIWPLVLHASCGRLLKMLKFLRIMRLMRTVFFFFLGGGGRKQGNLQHWRCHCRCDVLCRLEGFKAIRKGATETGMRLVPGMRNRRKPTIHVHTPKITRQGDNPDCCRMLRMSKLRAVWERIEVRIGSIAIIQSIMQLGRVEVHGICWIWELHCLVSLDQFSPLRKQIHTLEHKEAGSRAECFWPDGEDSYCDMFFNIQMSQKVDFTLVLKSCRSSLGPVLKWSIP